MVQIAKSDPPQGDDVLEFTVNGPLNALTSDSFLDSVRAAHQGQRWLILDFRYVGFMSSAGLRALLQLVRLFGPEMGRVIISGAPPEIVEIFRISGVTGVLRLTADLEEARQVAAA